MELRRQLGALRRWSWLLIASVLLAAGAAFLVSNSLPKVYEGKATLVVGQSTQATNPDLNQLLASQRLSQTYAQLATRSSLLEQVIAKNGLAITPDDLKKRIVADAPNDSALVHLTVQDGDSTVAAKLANSLAAEMIANSPGIAGKGVTSQQFIETNLAALQKQVEGFRELRVAVVEEAPVRAQALPHQHATAGVGQHGHAELPSLERDDGEALVRRRHD